MWLTLFLCSRGPFLHSIDHTKCNQPFSSQSCQRQGSKCEFLPFRGCLASQGISSFVDTWYYSVGRLARNPWTCLSLQRDRIIGMRHHSYFGIVLLLIQVIQSLRTDEGGRTQAQLVSVALVRRKGGVGQSRVRMRGCEAEVLHL